MRAIETGELSFTIVVDATIDVDSTHHQLVVRRVRFGRAYSVVSPNEERAADSASAIRIHSGTMSARTLVVSVSLLRSRAWIHRNPSPNGRRYTSWIFSTIPSLATTSHVVTQQVENTFRLCFGCFFLIFLCEMRIQFSLVCSRYESASWCIISIFMVLFRCL